MDLIRNVLVYNFGFLNDNEIAAAIVFAVGGLVVVLIRFLVCLGLNISKTGFSAFVKEVGKKKADPRTLKVSTSPVFSKIMAEYISIGEKGIGNINTKSIVDNRLAKLNIAGINYLSFEKLVEKIEDASVFIGLTLAVVYENKAGFAVLSIAVFVVFRLFAAIFDFRSIRDELSADMVSFLDREIGQFYIGDASSAIGRLKVELVVAINNLGNYFEKAMDKISSEFNKNIQKSMEEIANSVNFSMESLSKYAEYMDEPFENWKNAVENTAAAQNSLYEIIDNISAHTGDYNKLLKSIEISINGFTLTCEEQINSSNKLVCALTDTAAGLTDKYANIENLNKSLQTQLSALEYNQKALEISLAQYESSLKEVTSQVSGGIGSIISHHAEQAYTGLNSELKDNIKSIINSNNQVVHQIESMIEELIRVNRNN